MTTEALRPGVLRKPGRPSTSVIGRWAQASPVGIAARLVVWAALAYGVFALVNPGGSKAFTACVAVIYAMVGLSLNVLIGYTGQLSLGHQGFYGTGALFGAVASVKMELPFAASLVVASLAGGLLSLLLGLVSLRITGLYFSLVTLVVGTTLATSLFVYPPLTNDGNLHPVVPDFFSAKDHFFYLALVLLAVVLYLDTRLTRSKAGRALLALKENERVAEAFGIDVPLYKMVAFTFSGLVAGLAGGLVVFLAGVFSEKDYPFLTAIVFVVMTVVGGTGSRIGVVLGSVFFAVQTDLFKGIRADLVGSSPGKTVGIFFDVAPNLVGAALLLITLIFYPGGLAQQLRPVILWLGGHKFDPHASKGDKGPGAVEGSATRA